MKPSSVTGRGCSVSVIVSTYNRMHDLSRALESLLDQQGNVRFEVLIVDNGSTDDTRRVVDAVRSSSHEVSVTYLYEPRHGVSYGRNAGIEQAKAPIIAFTDDDCQPAANWVESIVRAFERHTDVDCIGGRVVARWPEHVPEWFTPLQASPLALCEHGDEEAVVDATKAATCLITANLAVRRHVFDKAGGFSPQYPRGQDRELQLRIWRAGYRGLYVPDVVVTVDVPPERLTKQYFRRWYGRYGDVHGRLRLLETIDLDGRLVEPITRGAILGVPPFLYRRLATTLMAWMWAVMRMRHGEAFFHENRVRYLTNYIRRRMRDRDPGQGARPFGRAARTIATSDCSPDARVTGRVLSPDSAGRKTLPDSSD
jgi:glycosyltransferase involved in cell wall biosynthesis